MDGARTLPALASRPESLSELVYAAIRDAIVNKQLAPGERITETAIAERLDVSKTPVREAMLRLQEVGLIEPEGRRGSRVAQRSAAAFEQAFEAREVLEGHFAEKVAKHADEALVRAIVTAANDSLAAAKAGDSTAFRAADRAFHDLIVKGGNNPRLAKILADYADLLATLRRRDFPSAHPRTPFALEHVSIAEAIANGDPAAASSRMREHIRSVYAYFDSSASATPDS